MAVFLPPPTIMVTPRTRYLPHSDKIGPTGCISIIGMAASGKTTIGAELAHILNWGQLDADNLIEAYFGAPLQTLSTAMSKEEFLDLEGAVIQHIAVKPMVISTGGSAIYRHAAIEHLRKMGPIIYIAVPLPIILERIARKPERGLAIAPGQTVEDLYNERRLLYEAAATFTVAGGNAPAVEYAETIARWLAEPL